MFRSPAAALGVSLALLAGRAAVAQPAPLPPEVLADTPDAAKVAYLRANVVAEGPVTGGFDLRFPRSFYDGKLFLLGESHGFAAPQLVDLALLTHLQQRIGLRDYVAEIDPVQAERLNAWLDGGDDALLTRFFDRWRQPDSQWGNTSFEAKLRGMRALNQRLAPGARIHIHGLDRVADWPWLAEWLTAHGAQPDAAALAAAKTNAERAKLALGWLAGVRDLGHPTARVLKTSLELTASGASRDKVMFATYAQIVRDGTLGQRPAYGLWGAFHVLQGGINGVPSLAGLVRASDLPTAKGVVSVMLMPLESAMQMPVPMAGGVRRMRLDGFNIDGPVVKVAGSATLKAASTPGRVTIWRLDAKGSPFLTGADFAAVKTSVGQDFKPDDPALPAAAYVQYVGVFRGSDWAPPLP